MPAPPSLSLFMVSEFSQSALIDKMQLNHVKNGFCLMLALTWVNLSGSNNPKAAFATVTTEQSLLLQMANSQSQVFNEKYLLWKGSYNESLDGITTFMTRNKLEAGTIGPIPIEEIHHVIRGMGVIIIEFPSAPRWQIAGVMWGVKNCGHAIGVFEGDGGVYIFDPNFGLLWSKLLTLHLLLQALWKEYGVTGMWYSKFNT